MSDRTFDEIPRSQQHSLNLKGTKDPGFRRSLLKKMRVLVEEAERFAYSSEMKGQK